MLVGVIAMQISSGLSLISCCIVVITILKLRLYEKIFTAVILYIAVSDALASVATVIGATPSGSFQCFFQGMVANYFELTSFVWATVMTYLIYCTVCKGQVVTDISHFKLLAWGFPILPTLLPMTTGSYANDDGTPGWCAVGARPGAPEWTQLLWYFLGFFVWLLLCIFIMLILLVQIAYKLWFVHGGTNVAMNSVVWKLIFYPLIIIFCWAIPSFVDITLQVDSSLVRHHNNHTDIIGAYVLPTAQGFLSAIVFFMVNKDIRDEAHLMVMSRGSSKYSNKTGLGSGSSMPTNSSMQSRMTTSNYLADSTEYGDTASSVGDGDTAKGLHDSDQGGQGHVSVSIMHASIRRTLSIDNPTVTSSLHSR